MDEPQNKDIPLTEDVVQLIRRLGGQVSVPKQHKTTLSAPLQCFHEIEWDKRLCFRNIKYNISNIVFDGVEFVNFNSDEWRDNEWIQKNKQVYLIASGDCYIATLPTQSKSPDFDVYLIFTKKVKGPIKLSQFLKSTVIEYTYSNNSVHNSKKRKEILEGSPITETKKRKIGERQTLILDLSEVDWDAYFSIDVSKSCIPNGGRAKQAIIWNSGKAPQIMRDYIAKTKEGFTLFEISKELVENLPVDISFMTLRRFINNVVKDVRQNLLKKE